MTLIVRSSPSTYHVDYYLFDEPENAKFFLREKGAKYLKIQENGRELWCQFLTDTPIVYELVEINFSDR